MEKEVVPAFKTKYRRELNQAFLILEGTEPYEEDYQIRMLKENQIEGLLPVIGRGVDQFGVYEYDISGKSSMKSLYGYNKITCMDMKKFLLRLSEVITHTTEYLLDVNHLLLEPEYIFCEEGRYYFCYYPKGNNNIWSAFHVLTEYFVRQTDYQDDESVMLAFMLHKETMEENYSLKKMIDAVQKQENGNKKEKAAGSMVPQKEEAWKSDEKPLEEEYNFIMGQEKQEGILRETNQLWKPIRQLFQKYKKPKWGDWDGLYIEEDEL